MPQSPLPPSTSPKRCNTEAWIAVTGASFRDSGCAGNTRAYLDFRTGGYMRWDPGGTSNDIEDRRDDSGGGGGFGGGFGGIHLGIGGTILLIILSFVFKTNLFSLFSGGSEPRQITRAADPGRDAQESREVQFVSFVLDDVQHTWEKLLP